MIRVVADEKTDDDIGINEIDHISLPSLPSWQILWLW
jgi:hypothetical protein